MTEGDAAGASYTVVLATQPAGDVTIAISGHAGTDLTLSGYRRLSNNVLTFTDQNWGTAQTVTVVAGEDDDATTDPDVTLAHAIGSTDDSAYAALADQTVTVSITENDAVGVTINPTSLTVTEGDADGPAIQLHRGPGHPARRRRDVHDLPSAATPPRTGTQTRSAVRDPGPYHRQHCQHGVRRPGRPPSPSRITENDAVGVTINPTSLTVTEGDAAGASYKVVLTSQPAGDVTIAISGHSGTERTLSGTTLTNNVLVFTDQNWGTAQTVKVVAGEDDDATTDPDVTLVHAISSTDDTDYDALADQSVTVSITENDVVGVTINPTTLTVTEGDAAGASYTVVLATQPAGDVTIAISGHAGTDLTLSGTGLSYDGELTFTDQNWGTAQTVTVKATEDGDADQDADVTLVHAVGSTDDTAYAALADQSVTVSITENDAVGVTINPTSLTVTEGDADGASYTVVLTSQPAGDVTLTISGHSGTDLTVSGTTLTNNVLTFTTDQNWSTAQTVKVDRRPRTTTRQRTRT